MSKDQVQIMHWWSLVRWFMVLVLFSVGLLHIRFQESSIENILFFGAFLGVLLLNITYHLQVFRHRMGMMVVQVVLDTIFAMIVVHITGGLNSYFVWVYLIAVITASISIPKVGGVFAGLFGSLSLLSLTALYQNGIISPTQPSIVDATCSTIYVLSYTGLFSGVAFVAGYLSDLVDKYRLADNELQIMRQQLADCQSQNSVYHKLHPVIRDVAKLKHDINTPLCVITLSLSRVKRAGLELNHEGLQKSDNEITEAVNSITGILSRVDKLNEEIKHINLEDK